MPGMMLMMTHQNAPRLPKPEAEGKTGDKEGGKEQSKPDNKQQLPSPKLSLLQDDRVEYNAQKIAMVVADTFEDGRDTARRLEVRFATAPAQLDFQQAKLRRTAAQSLGIDPEKVRVICPFVGGGFGSKGTTWSHVGWPQWPRAWPACRSNWHWNAPRCMARSVHGR